MARHADDAMSFSDVRLSDGHTEHTFLVAMHTTCAPSELTDLRDAAADADPGVLDGWFAALPSTDDRKSWWANLPGDRRNAFRAAFLAARG